MGAQGDGSAQSFPSSQAPDLLAAPQCALPGGGSGVARRDRRARLVAGAPYHCQSRAWNVPPDIPAFLRADSALGSPHAKGEPHDGTRDRHHRRLWRLPDRRVERCPMADGREPLGRALRPDPDRAARRHPDGLPAPPRARPCAFAHHRALPRQYRRAEATGRDRRHRRLGLRLVPRGHGARRFRRGRPIYRPHLRAGESPSSAPAASPMSASPTRPAPASRRPA